MLLLDAEAESRLATKIVSLDEHRMLIPIGRQIPQWIEFKVDIECFRDELVRRWSMDSDAMNPLTHILDLNILTEKKCVERLSRLSGEMAINTHEHSVARF